MSFSIIPSPRTSPNPVPALLPSHSYVTRCPELDLSVTHSPAPKTDHIQQKPSLMKERQQTKKIQSRPSTRGQTEKKRSAKVHFEDFVAVTEPEPHAVPHQYSGGGQRGSSCYYNDGRCSVDPQAAAFVQDPGFLEKAELNSTLALKGELLSIQETEFNSEKALQQTLQKSLRTRTLINARATEVVNVSRSQHLFNSLVHISLQKDELLSQVPQTRFTFFPLSSCCYENKTAESPSLTFFINSDLFRKKPLPQEEETAKCKSMAHQWHLMAYPAFSTFDLCKRQRCWEATH